MRWIIVTQDFPPGFDGGIASWAEDLAAALARAGEAVLVLARRTPAPPDTAAWDAAQPFAVRRVWGRSWARWQGTWMALAAWPHLGPDVRILCATWPLAAGLVGRLRGAHLGVAFHGSDLTRLSQQAPPPSLARVVHAAHALLPVSRFLAGQLQARVPTLDPARLRVLPMPLAPLPPPSSAAAVRPELVVLSRLTPLKGVERALHIAAALGRPLCIIGEGEARAALEALAGPGVRFLGRLPRTAALEVVQGAAAMLLLPRTDADGSGAEGMGLCLLEAAQRGVPAIGCRTGGVPEAAGVGLLLDDPDHPNLDAISAFLADSGQRTAAWRWVHDHHTDLRAVAVLREALA